MRKLIVLVLAALLTTVGVAGATSKDQGRRLAGPFCIGKTTVSPLRLKNIFGQTVTVPRAGIVRSIGLGQKCNANENRRFGVPVKGGAGAKGDSGPIGPQGPLVPGANGGLAPRVPRAKSDRATGEAGAPGPEGRHGRGRSSGRERRHRRNRRPGLKGDTGATGAQGAKGDTGATGAQGPAGATGAQGAKGDTGATGAQGPAGATGAQGAKGDTGATGAKGDKGDTGAAGAGGVPRRRSGSGRPAGPAGPRVERRDHGLGRHGFRRQAVHHELPGALLRHQRRVRHPGLRHGDVPLIFHGRPDRNHSVDDPPVLGSKPLGHGVRLLRTDVVTTSRTIRRVRPPQGGRTAFDV